MMSMINQQKKKKKKKKKTLASNYTSDSTLRKTMMHMLNILKIRPSQSTIHTYI